MASSSYCFRLRRGFIAVTVHVIGLALSSALAGVGSPLHPTLPSASAGIPSGGVGGPAGVPVVVAGADDDQDNFYFDPAPIDQDVIEGREARLRCDVSNRRSIVFYWTLNGRTVPNASRRYQDNSDLRILRADRVQDSGSFRCVATNVTTGVALRSIEAKLNVLWIDKQAEVQIKSTKDGDDGLESTSGITLKCNVEGNPEPNIEWLRNKLRLYGNDRVRMHKNRLRLMSVTAGDNGVYECRAENVAGAVNSSNSYLLNVPGPAGSARLDPDSFSSIVLARRMASASFQCRYTSAAATGESGSGSSTAPGQGSGIVGTEWYFDQKRIAGNQGATAVTGSSISAAPRQSRAGSDQRASGSGPSSGGGGNSQKYTMLSNGTLIVNRVEESDVGIYHCVGTGSVGPVQTFAAELQLAYLEELDDDSFDPKPPQLPQPIVMPLGGKLDIQCRASKGLPKPTVRWQGPGGIDIPEVGGGVGTDSRGVGGRSTTAVQDSGVLSLINVDESETGNYTCVVDNVAGRRTRSVWIAVSVPPTIARPPLSTRVTEGEAARFDCRVTGSPYPVTVVSWTTDEAPLNLQDPRIKVDQAAGTLTISDVILADENNYACVVNTTAQSVIMSTNAHLYVEKRLKFKPVPVNAKLELNSVLRVPCRAEGSVPPTIRWYSGELGVTGTSLSPRLPDGVRGESSGDLVFDPVDRRHAGVYTCVATSEQGTINATIRVDVVVKPKFKVRPVNTTVIEGQTAMIHCLATGEPTPTIQWDRNGRINDFDFSRFKVLNNGTLAVTEVYMEDSGRFGCTAGNSGGLERIEVHMHVIGADARHRDKSLGGGAGFGGDDAPLTAAVNGDDMIKTILIAVCSAVAYLAVVVGLTVYCSIRLIRAKNMRKQRGNGYNNNSNSSSNGQTNGRLDPTVHENGADTTENTRLMSKMSSAMSKDLQAVSPATTMINFSGTVPATSEFEIRSAASYGVGGEGPGSAVSSLMAGGGSSLRRGPTAPSQHHYSSPASSAVGVPAYDRTANTLLRNQLQLISMLGKGAYGDVLLAKTRLPSTTSLTGVSPGLGGPPTSASMVDTLVIVKSLLSRCDAHVAECRREIELFSRVNHDHVTRLVGLCYQSEPIYLVTEYCEWGDLKTFLRATNGVGPGSSASIDRVPGSAAGRLPPLSVTQLVTMCGQVALGMEHIAERGLTHRDLAARNILLTQSLHLKVALPGLCRDVYATEYVDVGAGRILPLRWTAPEVLAAECTPLSSGSSVSALSCSSGDGNHYSVPGVSSMTKESAATTAWSTYSDVWSFGVLAWEVFSGAVQLPYATRTDGEVLAAMLRQVGIGGPLTSTCRLARPPSCPADVWTLVEACTTDSPYRRPTFSDVVNLIYDLTVSSASSSISIQ